MQEFDPRRRTVRLAPRLFVAAAGLAVLALGWRMTASEEAIITPPMDPATFAALQHIAFAQAEALPGFSRGESIPVEVRPGETLEAAVQRSGVGADEARQVVQTLSSAMDTVNIRAGMDFIASVARPADHRGPARLVGLSMRTGQASTITVSRTFDGALRLREMEEKVADETRVACGDIQGSFHESATKVGATAGIMAEATKLFAHKIDFSRDIKPGDDFCLVFDRKVTESGRTIEAGDLQYAELNGVKFYEFTRADGKAQFFDEAGKNIKGFLLRTPVDGARITSGFGFRRHPILGYNKMHQGIDFGAGSGTPVLAAGDGVVEMAGRFGGYGNWVKVRHSGGYSTGYAHLSRYARGLRPGQSVSQGQVIGYVGSTGRSTGPHLHYEIFFKGARVNPIGAKVPTGTILAGAELAKFRSARSRIDALLAAKGREPVEDSKKLAGADFKEADQVGLRKTQVASRGQN
ncbi:MAG: M23 family metallopeptidase [Caulobacteraceae bacterium]|nr:M23 family metallopeptidase [Caulobacteraceae bacterium]